MKFRWFMVSISVCILTSFSLSFAQGTCPQIVEQALTSLGDNCEALRRNTACYGYNLVSAEFSEAVEDDFFSHPADTSGLDILESITTAEMNTDLSQWGVAVMNLQANIPNSIPGQAVKFVLLGDVEVESVIEPETTFKNADSIDVVVDSDANIHSGPSQNFNVIGSALADETLGIDGQSADGNWYRTIVNNRVGWIFGELLVEDDMLTDLPILDGQQRSLMQAFYLRTGIGTPACEEAPSDTLVVQGPKNIEIDLTVNGADIQIGSTIAMRILPPGNIIEFTVIDGQLTVIGGGANGEDLIVQANYRTTACLSEPDDLGVDGDNNDRLIDCEFTTPEFVPDPDLGQAFCILEDVPTGLLNYSIDLDCPDIIQSVSTDSPDVTTVDPPANPPNDGEDIVVGTGHGDPNLCFEGNTWGDGRCKTDYDWQAGFYYGQLEAGLINLEDIPEPFYIVPTPFPSGNGDSGGSSNPVKGSLSCGASINEYEVTITSLAASDTGADVFFDIGATTFPFGSISVPPALPQTISNMIGGAGISNIKIVGNPSGKTKKLGSASCP